VPFKITIGLSLNGNFSQMVILQAKLLLEEHKKDIRMISRITSNLAFLHWHMQDQLILNDMTRIVSIVKCNIIKLNINHKTRQPASKTFGCIKLPLILNT
jgi:hypothetical protein